MALLGLTAIRGIAAAGCLDRMTPPRTGSAFDPEQFRRHSLAVGCAAQQLSRAAGLNVDAEAFMAGLLHDIGVLLLVKAAPEAMARFVPAEAESVAQALAHEHAEIGATHEAGATVLAQTWQLPDWLQGAVATHHTVQPEAQVEPFGLHAMPALLAVADLAAHRAGLGLWPVCGLPPPPGTLAALGLDDAALDAVVLGLPDTVAGLNPA
jgi:HD-like signal output (HDOD) protein